MRIDETAPAQARVDVHIAASPEEVWAVVGEVPAWPAWDPDVEDVSVDGPAVAGAAVSWWARGAAVDATLRVVRPLEELGWTGVSAGLRGECVYRLEPEGAGTRLSVAASWSGLWPRLLPGRYSRRLQHRLEDVVSFLDGELGRRAIAAAARELELARTRPPTVPEAGPAEAA